MKYNVVFFRIIIIQICGLFIQFCVRYWVIFGDVKVNKMWFFFLEKYVWDIIFGCFGRVRFDSRVFKRYDFVCLLEWYVLK